jgi:hypothetical protein
VTASTIVGISTSVVPGLLLLLGGVSKAFNLPWFIKTLSGHNLLPRRVLWHAAVVIVAIETATGALLVLGAAKPWPGLIAGFLYLVFAFYIGRSLFAGHVDAECGCVKLPRPVVGSWRGIARNISLTVLCLMNVRVDTAATLAVASAAVGLLSIVAATIWRDAAGAGRHAAHSRGVASLPV